MREFFKGNAGTVPPTTAAVVQVSSPTSSTVTGPSVNLAASATAPNPITFMRIYVDNVSVASASTSKIAATVSMSKATHSVVFQAWDSNRQRLQNSENHYRAVASRREQTHTARDLKAAKEDGISFARLASLVFYF